VTLSKYTQLEKAASWSIF